MEILAELREGRFDVLVGVNLLREGLDLPEVGLVAILDADKEGYLRSATSLIQTMGRAARNADSEVIMYADSITGAMRTAMDETQRRRAKQIAYNEQHGIIPKTITKEIRRGIEEQLKAGRAARSAVADNEPPIELSSFMAQLEGDMLEAAQSLQFERAAQMRDQLRLLQEHVTQQQSLGIQGRIMLTRSELAAVTGVRGGSGPKGGKRARKSKSGSPKVRKKSNPRG